MARERKEITPEELIGIWFDEVKRIAHNLANPNPEHNIGAYNRPNGWKDYQRGVQIGAEVLVEKIDGLQAAVSQFVVHDSPSFHGITEYAAMFAITEERAHKLFDAIERIITGIPMEEFQADILLIQIRERIGKAKGLTQDERDYVFFVVGALLAHYTAKSVL